MTENVWTRPESVPFPSTWRRFKVKQKNGITLSFRIQDITPDLYDDVIDHMLTIYAREELLNRSVRLTEDEVSVQEFNFAVRKYLDQRLGLVCLVEDEGKQDRIAGVNITAPSQKGVEFDINQLQGKAVRQLVEFALVYAERDLDLYAWCGTDVYITALGLSVHPDFRGQGIGLELLKARFDLGRAVGITATVTLFTGIASQILAHKLGFEVIREIYYSDYKVDGEAIFQNDTTKSLKIMGKKIK